MKSLVIIGGGHAGLKCYSHMKELFDVVTIIDSKNDSLNLKQKYEYLKFNYREDTCYYISTPNEFHMDWAMSLPENCVALIEKSITVEYQEFNTMQSYLTSRNIKWTTNLPWRVCEFKKDDMFLDKGIEWERPKGWHYKKMTVPIGIDIGYHLLDIYHRISPHFSTDFNILINEKDCFLCTVNGVYISAKYVSNDKEKCSIFGQQFSPIIPEEWFKKYYTKVLYEKDFSICPTVADINWIQVYIYLIYKDFIRREHDEYSCSSNK